MNPNNEILPVQRMILFLVTAFLLFVTNSTYALDSELKPAAGIVEGDTIWLETYSKEVGRRAEYLGESAGASADVFQAAWLDMVKQTLMVRQAAKKGIVVDSADVDSILTKATPSFVRRGVVDANGKFDLPTLITMLHNPDSLVSARAPEMTPAEHRAQVVELITSMQELRAQVKLTTTIQLLQEDLKMNFTLDTAALYRQFVVDATQCEADVVFMPCTKRVGTPIETDVQRFYSANQHRYETRTELRRIAILSWVLRAASVDSSLVLGNVNEFLRFLKTAKSKRERDSIWIAVAATTISGSASLHPDSVNQKDFYKAVKGQKIGAYIGPVILPSGVHVLHVDSSYNERGTKKRVYNVRIIATSIEPSRETIDSILADVTKAQQLYDSGTPLGEVATLFNRNIELSPYFSASDNLFGSYRIVEAAFNTQVAASLPPVETSDRGVVVGIVIDSVSPGPKPLDAIYDNVVADLKQQMGCTASESMAKAVRGVVTRLPEGNLMIGDSFSGVEVLREVDIQVDGAIGATMYDTLAANAATGVTQPGLIGPFLGTTGWFIINVLSIRHPAESEFDLYFNLHKNETTDAQFEWFWDKYQGDLVKNASVTDNRWMYFRY